ncbi:hypothetical protein SAMN05444166_0678 [Singulisphaera sp. GP187]|uniref:hypothetical protein n=1 Tax=Singulisphaera sp. GP187 TaxID=1882752 RepID=UPI000927D469|nr:hypothetical protein [Singulisphaera sp. GP187]SIN75855.1 hypothetical protein SAMN05444166_0678 [Singulisphaera sp. GP187]
MSRLQYRGSIALAAVVVALLSSRPADAQVIVDQGPPRQPVGLLNSLVTGSWFEIKDEAKAEHRLQHLQAKLSRDGSRGDLAAVNRDVRRIDNVKFRLAVDDWLIRKNSLQCFGYYPIRVEPLPCAASCPRPPQAPVYSLPVPTPGPMAAAPTIPITILNADPAGAGVAFAINGVTHQAAGGSRQDLAVAPGSNITYDGGGSLGQRQYLISPGLYEFRSTAEGRALYKLPGTR